MFGDLMGKLQEMKQKMEESKKRLDAVSMQAEAGSGQVKVTITGNREIKSIDISEELLKSGDKEEIEELLIVAINRAISQADKVNESEMQGAAKGMLPNMPGLF